MYSIRGCDAVDMTATRAAESMASPSRDRYEVAGNPGRKEHSLAIGTPIADEVRVPPSRSRLAGSEAHHRLPHPAIHLFASAMSGADQMQFGARPCLG